MTGGLDPTDQGTTTVYSYNIPEPSTSNCASPGFGYDCAGNLKQVTDFVAGAWSYSYDTLNRLLAANSATTNTLSQYAGKNGCWSYDPFGNRTTEYYQSAACPTPETSVPVAGVNQITYNSGNQVLTVNQAGSPTNLHGTFQYDGAGDVLNDITNKYLYDAEGRLCAVENLTLLTMTGYIYGADGARVAKGPITSWSCNPATNGFLASLASGAYSYTSYVLGLGGEQVSEISVSGSTNSWKHTNIFAGGKLMATYNGTGVPGTYFDLSDWLGTKRAEFGTANGGCLSTYFSLAYGDGLPPSSSGTCPTDATEQHFTGKERDTESGNDYFGARYYASSMGRFMSPDWSAKAEPVPYAKLDNPQTLNLYAYLRNNPLAGVDADGHCPGGPETCGPKRTEEQVTNTVYNESRDVKEVGNGSQASKEDLHKDLTHTIVNGDEKGIKDTQRKMAPDTLDPKHNGAGAEDIKKSDEYKQTKADVHCACQDIKNGAPDPTGGSVYFNNRSSDSTAPRDMSGGKYPPLDIQHQDGPFIKPDGTKTWETYERSEKDQPK